MRKLYRRGPCHLPHPLFSPLDGEYFTRRSRTVVHHSCLNRGSIYERYHLFSRPMKFTASIFRHRTRLINILPPSIDPSIDFYPPSKRYQPLSLHVCIRSYINFAVMIRFPPFFFFPKICPFLESRSSNIWGVLRSFFDSREQGTVKRQIFGHIDRISNDFREDSREKGRYLRDDFQRWSNWTRSLFLKRVCT